ncbi:hypothetical protein NDU88_004780 [Pleurodeles waltl]|uniref:Uncharacterized protein n=1 Tax=Pleurodeles waltl TaxID=8319 RepID=A0AAV7QH29_PLEWA|nr:hypothetical protein NDU88_004780 [Pleurodeles waltl]
MNHGSAPQLPARETASGPEEAWPLPVSTGGSRAENTGALRASRTPKHTLPQRHPRRGRTEASLTFSTRRLPLCVVGCFVPRVPALQPFYAASSAFCRRL